MREIDLGATRPSKFLRVAATSRYARAVADRVIRLGAYIKMPLFTVGVIGLVRDDEGRYLMVRKGLYQAGMWGFPGGFARNRENPGDSLRRELREETSVLCWRYHVAATYKQPWARHYDVVLVVDEFTVSSAPRKSWLEISECGWFTLAQLRAMDNLTREARCLLNECDVLEHESASGG